MIGDTVDESWELISPDHEVVGITQLINGADAVVMIFIPFCYGEVGNGTMEALVLDVNRRIDEFNGQDLRVVCVTKEPPSTARHWTTDRGIQLDVFTDGTLLVSNALVGTFDLSAYVAVSKGVQLGTYMVPMPGIVLLGGDGKIINKYVASSPETVQIATDDILKMLGL